MVLHSNESEILGGRDHIVVFLFVWNKLPQITLS